MVAFDCAILLSNLLDAGTLRPRTLHILHVTQVALSDTSPHTYRLDSCLRTSVNPCASNSVTPV